MTIAESLSLARLLKQSRHNEKRRSTQSSFLTYRNLANFLYGIGILYVEWAVSTTLTLLQT